MYWPYYVCPTLVRVSMESTDTLPRVYPWVGHTMYVQHWSEYPWNPRILCQGCIHGLAILCMSNIGQSIHGIRGYFAKGVSMGWPYYVCLILVKVSMESTDTLPRGIHGLAILCMSSVGQSIHGIRGYFAKGVSMGWPYYVCLILVKVSMESTDTLPRGIHGLAILCMSNIGQSIHGIRGYFAKGVSMGWPYYVSLILVRVSMESVDTLPRGIHGLAILCMSSVAQSIHGIHGYFAKGVSMGWPYYVCSVLVRVSMESADTLPRGYPWVGHTMYV